MNLRAVPNWYQSIGFLAGPQISASGAKRILGYRSALQNLGLNIVPEWVRYCDPNAESAQEAASQLLSDYPELTALVCFNDLMAVGALKAAIISGRIVPDDLAVVGFDDIPLAELVTPALTTCRVPRYTLGGQAMDLVLAQLL